MGSRIYSDEQSVSAKLNTLQRSHEVPIMQFVRLPRITVPGKAGGELQAVFLIADQGDETSLWPFRCRVAHLLSGRLRAPRPEIAGPVLAADLLPLDFILLGGPEKIHTVLVELYRIIFLIQVVSTSRDGDPVGDARSEVVLRGLSGEKSFRIRQQSGAGKVFWIMAHLKYLGTRIVCKRSACDDG